jgi:hypothetical protein
MSVPRVVVLMAVMVAAIVAVGCVSRPPLPADILRAFEAQGMSFQASEPIVGSMSASATLQLIRANHARPFLDPEPLGPPIYGIVSCVDPRRCDQGPPFGVWIIRFPGQQSYMAPPRPDESIVVNAATGETLFSVGR